MSPLVEAFYEFSVALCRLGHGREVEIDVPLRTFVALVSEARETGAMGQQYSRRPLRVPVAKYALPDFAANAVASTAQSKYVELDEGIIVDGLKLHLLYGPWTIRIRQPESDRLLEQWRALQ